LNFEISGKLILKSGIKFKRMAGDTLDLPLYKEYAPLCIPAQDHYICEDGRIKCLPGWQGDLCQVNYAKSAKLSNR
jgi:hypothetical protein